MGPEWRRSTGHASEMPVETFEDTGRLRGKKSFEDHRNSCKVRYTAICNGYILAIRLNFARPDVAAGLRQAEDKLIPGDGQSDI